MFTKFTSGTRPSSNAERAVSLLRYIPTKRRPWLPSTFAAKNVPEKDLAQMWGHSRGQHGPTEPWGGYSDAKSYNVRSAEKVDMIPKAELEKFMPDISIGSAAAVTPVSLMSVRAGHRVTHDLLHTYDPATTVYGTSRVDHDALTPHDKQRVGLHGDVLGCREAIYRWLRRGPMSQEKNYFRLQQPQEGTQEMEAEVALTKRVVRLAKSGQLKAACEEYRRFTATPPVRVYRALLKACVPQGLIGDAVSIFTDGIRLRYVTRDAACFKWLLMTAINADNVVRVMWAYDMIRGNFSTNTIARAEIDPFTAYSLHLMALRYLLDGGHADEARTVYSYLSERDLLSMDLYTQAGLAAREAMERGETVELPSDLSGLGLSQLTDATINMVATLWRERLAKHERAALASDEDASPVEQLLEAFGDIDIRFVLRAAVFDGERNLLETDGVDQYKDRCLAWLEVLSAWKTRVAAPLPYLLKSKPSRASGKLVRVASLPSDSSAVGRLSASDQKFEFWYDSDGTRFVTETYPSLSVDSNTRKYLVRDPVQREVPVAIAELGQPRATVESRSRIASGRLVHESVSSATPSAGSGGSGSWSSAPAGTSGGPASADF